MRKASFSWVVVVTVLFRIAIANAQPAPERVRSSPAHGFHHDYFLVLPATLKTNATILLATPTPPTSLDPADFTAAAERIVRNAGAFIDPLGLPLLVPVLPRPPLKVSENHYINVLLPGLSRAALLEREEKLARIDRQVLAMVDHARARIKEEVGIDTHPKIIVAGFSAAGHFATRMAVLHPERVLAAWAGGISGHPVVPLSRYEGRELTYPVGIADLEAVSGRAFNPKAFKSMPIMLVQGEADTNTSLPSEPKPSESYSYEQAQLVFTLLGKTPLERLEKAKQLYEQAGANVQTRVYPGAGHQINPEIARDMVEFIALHASTASK